MHDYRVRWLRLDRAGDWFGVYRVEVPDDGSEDPALMERTMVGPLAIFADRQTALGWEPPTEPSSRVSAWHEVRLPSDDVMAIFPELGCAQRFLEDIADTKTQKDAAPA